MAKTANVIIVGGTIAAGKSTLVNELSKHYGWYAVPELREGDEIQEIILKKLYEGGRIHLATVQYYFITNRFKQYQENSNGLVTSILDRGIWEDWIFAKLLMKSEPKSYEHYKVLWTKTVERILEEFGAPKAYVYLKVDWDTFRKRIYNRNREAEINNFARNEEYFKELLTEYVTNFTDLLRKWGVNVIEIDTDKMDVDQVTKYTIQALDKLI